LLLIDLQELEIRQREGIIRHEGAYWLYRVS
jgi:hypothetical protein